MYKASGKIIVALPGTGGVTKDGKDWYKKDYVMDTEDKYHTKLRFSMTSFDGEIENPPKVGDNVEIGFSIECREFKGNWFNDVKALQMDIL